jgi:hypothetical protein
MLKSVTLILLIAAIPVFLTPGIAHFPLVFSTSCFFLGYAVTSACRFPDPGRAAVVIVLPGF